MREYGSGAILATGERLSSVPDHTLVRVVDGRTKHTFYVRDLLRHINVRLQNSDYFISEPLQPTNPMTGLALSSTNVTRVVLTAFSSPARIRIPHMVLAYWKCKQNLEKYMNNEIVALHELALENEAREGGDELVMDILSMYELANIEDQCPDITEASGLDLLDVLLCSHRTALAEYYRATRSWCEYTAQQARVGLPGYCIQAAKEYYQKTDTLRLQSQEQSQYAPYPFNRLYPLANTTPMVICMCGQNSPYCSYCRSIHNSRVCQWNVFDNISDELVEQVDRWSNEQWPLVISTPELLIQDSVPPLEWVHDLDC